MNLRTEYMKMAKVNISFRVQPYHYRAIREDIGRGDSLTNIFEEMLNYRYPISSKKIK